MFVGSVRDNIILARESSPDSVVIEALKTVEAWDWVERLPRRLDTLLGSGNTKLTPAQAQQMRSPGWWSPIRTLWCWMRRHR